MNMRKQLKTPIFIAIGIIIIFAILGNIFLKDRESPQTESISVKPVSSELVASGTIKSENEATLHFTTGGKLVYLPFKEGDKINRRQTIAQLDTYTIQKQLTAALNTYRITRDTFDQTQNNALTGVLQGAQKYSLQVTNKGGFDVDSVMGDIVKRILDQNQATLDNSVINVELANYAYQLASLTSPINGIIYHQDVSVPYVNVTPATSFIVIDPKALVFRANVSENDIDFVDIRSVVLIQLDAIKGKSFSGTVTKIYPGKVTLANGTHVYQIDIQSDELLASGKYDQAGSVVIKSNAKENLTLVPIWTILANEYIWVIDDNKAVMKKIRVGKTHGENIEILEGLSANDKIIVNPKYLVAGKYQIL